LQRIDRVRITVYNPHPYLHGTYRPPHPSAMALIDKEPWDRGWKLVLLRDYIVEALPGYKPPRHVEAHEYLRLVPQQVVERYGKLLGELSKWRAPVAVDMVYAMFLASGTSFTPSLASAFTGLDEVTAERALTTLRERDVVVTVPAAELPNILGEDQRVLRRYVKPEYWVREVQGRYVPREGVVYEMPPLIRIKPSQTVLGTYFTLHLEEVPREEIEWIRGVLPTIYPPEAKRFPYDLKIVEKAGEKPSVSVKWNMPVLWVIRAEKRSYYDYWPPLPNAEFKRFAAEEEFNRFMKYMEETEDWMLKPNLWPLWFRSEWKDLGYEMERVHKPEAKRELEELSRRVAAGWRPPRV